MVSFSVHNSSESFQLHLKALTNNDYLHLDCYFKGKITVVKMFEPVMDRTASHCLISFYFPNSVNNFTSLEL